MRAVALALKSRGAVAFLVADIAVVIQSHAHGTIPTVPTEPCRWIGHLRKGLKDSKRVEIEEKSRTLGETLLGRESSDW